jgi:hypothetical protein
LLATQHTNDEGHKFSYKALPHAAGINPDVALESYTMNITTLRGFDAFKDSLVGHDGRSRVDLVLSCVDNYEARMTINQARLPILSHHLWTRFSAHPDLNPTSLFANDVSLVFDSQQVHNAKPTQDARSRCQVKPRHAAMRSRCDCLCGTAS